MPFEEGNNFSKGRPKGSTNKVFLPIKELIKEHGEGEDPDTGKPRITTLMEKLYTLSMGGNVLAIKEYLDRVVGKSKESIDLTSDGEKLQPSTIVILPKAEQNEKRPDDL